MAVKIKLKRIGKIRVPQYRIVVADSRTRRNGRAIEELGIYHPKEEPSLIRVDSDRVQHWLSVGAQPTEPVLAILKVTGDWQRFRGEPGAEGTLKVAEPKSDKARVFEAAAKEAVGEKDRISDARARAAKKAAAARDTARPQERPGAAADAAAVATETPAPASGQSPPATAAETPAATADETPAAAEESPAATADETPAPAADKASAADETPAPTEG